MKIEDIIPGRAYKYKGLWCIAGLWNNKLHLYCNADYDKKAEVWGHAQPVNPEITSEMAEELEEWLISNNETPTSPKAKEIALEAALKVFTPHNATAEDIVEAAEALYQWLIK